MRKLVDYRDMVTMIRDRIKSMIDKGMTLEQVKAANPTQGYRARYGSDSGSWTTDMFVEAVYHSLRSTAKVLRCGDRSALSVGSSRSSLAVVLAWRHHVAGAGRRDEAQLRRRPQPRASLRST